VKQASRKILAVAMFALSLSVCVPPQAWAERDYQEEDAEVLSVAASFLRPVGQLLEAVVFRPLHVLFPAADPHDGISDRPVRSCRSLRPRRDCSSR
jgi:hypothetical protein